MELLTLMIRLALAAIFATAGIAKFADLKGSEKAFKDFGVPESVALPGSILLSVAEVVIAALLLFTSFSWFAAVGAAVLLSVFIVQMAYQYAKGNAPDCHCFGQVHSEPVGIKSIVRNVVFLALTAVLLFRGAGAQGLSIINLTITEIPVLLGTLLVLMMAGALLNLRKLILSQTELSRRLDVLEVIAHDGEPVDHEHAADPVQSLPIGAPLPEFQLTTLDGEVVSSRQLSSIEGKPLLLIFVSPTCGPCQALLPDLVRWRSEMADRVEFVFVSSGSEKGNRKKFASVGDAPVLLDDERQFALALGGRWTPTALFVDADGKVASSVAAGDLAIEELVEQLQGSDLGSPMLYFSNGNNQGRAPKIGTRIPDFKLTDTAGREVDATKFQGRPTLAAFWSVTCPHCTAFADELKQWERSRHNGDPHLLIFSDGDEEAHKDLGFESSVVLDKGYKIAGKLGMFGTPSAVLLNKDGVVISETAIGADNIMALLGKRRDGTN